MGLETIRMRDLEGKAKNMYEAVTVMAKRAKHINNLRLSKKEEILDHDDTEEYSAEPIAPIINTVKETKVATVALNEFLNGEIEFEYIEPMPVSEDEVLDESADEEKTEES